MLGLNERERVAAAAGLERGQLEAEDVYQDKRRVAAAPAADAYSAWCSETEADDESRRRAGA